MTVQASDQLAAVSRVLGAELRIARQRLGWTRPGLGIRLSGTPSASTIASYETGSRRISAQRFLEICTVLDVQADRILRRAIRACAAPDPDSVTVDLAAVATTSDERLQGLRRWAALSLCKSDGKGQVRALDRDTIVILADLVAIPVPQLIDILREL